MWARKRIDIGWRDLAAAVCSLPVGRSDALATRVEKSWGPNTLACLSVRTALDLVLQALNLPAGSEVLISAITIPDIVSIVQQHQLVPVPIDVCPDDLSIDIDSLAAAITDRTRLVLVAHLFGSIMPMQPVIDLVEDQGVPVFEDCAQAFCGNDYRGHADSDFAAFSFGPIKTATALGGGLVSVRNPATLERMRQIQQLYALQSRFDFARRIARHSLLKLLGLKSWFRLLAMGSHLAGRNLDQVVGALAKNFPAGQLLNRLRRRPSAPLLALLRRRLARFDHTKLQLRANSGKRLRECLGRRVDCPGSTPQSTFWVFAVRSHAAKLLARELRSNGFDATIKSSLRVLSPLGSNATVAPMAEALLPELVFVPAYPEMPRGELERLAELIRNIEDEVRTKNDTSDPIDKA